MGILDRKTAPLSSELQNIKEQVENAKNEKNVEEPPQKLKKTNFVEDSQNLNDIGSLELKLIKILNEIENVKARVDEDSRKVVEEVKTVYTDVEGLRDLVKDVPRETLAELRNMKKNLPMVYDGLKQSIGEHIRSRVISAIDSNILKVIRDSRKVNSTDLLTKVETAHICSKNTLYVHLARLEEEGYIVKKRELHEVYYMVTENVKESLGNEGQTAPVPTQTPGVQAPADKEAAAPPIEKQQ